MLLARFLFFFFSSRRRHTRLQGDWSSDVCSSDLATTRDLTAGRSRRRSRAPWAAAPATSRSTRPSNWPRLACEVRRQSRHRRRSMAAGKRKATERRKDGKGMQDPAMVAPSVLPSFRRIGKAFRKVDATAKVTGVTKFADDLFLPRMLFARVLRSTQPHARIRRIDVSRALALDGVHAVLTGRDLPIPFGILPVSQDEHALALDKVRFVGDPRSEEHTSELQSPCNLVCRLLLEKKKRQIEQA